jgi:hypothetical protein
LHDVSLHLFRRIEAVHRDGSRQPVRRRPVAEQSFRIGHADPIGGLLEIGLLDEFSA